jgi:hypothetical protein
LLRVRNDQSAADISGYMILDQGQRRGQQQVSPTPPLKPGVYRHAGDLYCWHAIVITPALRGRDAVRHSHYLARHQGDVPPYTSGRYAILGVDQNVSAGKTATLEIPGIALEECLEWYEVFVPKRQRLEIIVRSNRPNGEARRQHELGGALEHHVALGDVLGSEVFAAHIGSGRFLSGATMSHL